ncbi:uncharacterized protein DS421_15g493710 [Arachis hypogaea]|nr:uncharacterized protein DS421_15g493710 [Arachis hypogaea]
MTVIFKAKLMEIEFTENTEAPARISTTMRKLVRSSTLRPPPSGWIKCNVDADFIKTLAGGATAAVFRAHSSNLLTGLNSKIVAGSALAAEALAVKEALIMAKIFQIENIIIESDRVILTQALKPGTSIVEIQPILEDILDIVGSISNCGFTWVPRGWNALAHEVAKLAAVGTFGKNWVTCMPQTINNIVKKERCVVATEEETMFQNPAVAPEAEIGEESEGAGMVGALTEGGDGGLIVIARRVLNAAAAT